MKNILFSFTLLVSLKTFAVPGIHEALKNPSSIQVLKLSGEKDEAAMLTKNAKHFSVLKEIIISGISDSVLMEQDLASVAACNNVHQLKIENCGITNLPGVMKMLVGVNEVSISDCKKLSGDNAFQVLNEMPSLKFLNYQTDHLSKLPAVFCGMKSLEKISIHNTDLSLADGYALNNSSLSSLFVRDSLSLGFGANKLVLEYGCYDKNTTREHISIMRDMLQGAAGANGEMPLPQRAQAFTRENPLIHPPLANVEVRKNIYSTSAMSGGEIEYPSGTKIFIPPHAFVDANGNEIKGDVTIDYREFRDLVDILVSGIPMQYDSAGQSGEFQSAGMFEMNASVDGKEIFLAPGKKVDMQFAVVDTASTYNFYKLDPKNGWQYLQQTGKVETKAETVSSSTVADNNSEAAIKFLNKTAAFFKTSPDFRDTTSFDRIYNDTDYYYMRKGLVYQKRDYKNEMKIASRWKMKKVYSQKGTFCFNLTQQLTRDKNSRNYSNPEMSRYRNITWELNQKVDRATMKRLRSSKSGINDVRITYNGGTDFTMELKVPAGYFSFSVTPVTIGEKKKVIPFTEEKCMKMDKGYERQLNNRKRSFGNAIKHRVAKYQKWEMKMQRDSLAAWSSVKNLMTDNEKKMTFSDWVSYSNKFRKFNFTNIDSVAGSANTIYQALSIMEFGVFNCDQIQRIQNPEQVNAVAFADTSVQEKAVQMFIIAKNKNQAFSYYGGGAGASIPIAFGKNDDNKLVVVDADGTVSFGDNHSFATRQPYGKGNTAFATTRMSEKPVTPQQLRAFIYPETTTGN